MAAVVIVSIKKGWGGDIRRNRVVFTAASATTDSLTPGLVGLHRLTAIVATGRIGSHDGQTLAGASNVSWNSASDIIIAYGSAGGGALSSGNVEADFYGI